MPTTLRITAPSGKELCSIEVQEGTGLAEVQIAIEQATQIDIDEQRLIRGSEALCSDKSIAALGDGEIVDILLVQMLHDDAATCVSLRYEVRSILAGATVRNIGETVSRLAQLHITVASELDFVAKDFVKQAIVKPNCCEIYANIAQDLMNDGRLPVFPMEDGREDTFKRRVVNSIQEMFEAFDLLDLPDESAALVRKHQRERALAHAKLLGHLFKREWISAKTIGLVTHTLIGPAREMPTPLSIEYVCVLMRTIGTIQNDKRVGMLMRSVATRLVSFTKATPAAKPLVDQINVIEESFLLGDT